MSDKYYDKMRRIANALDDIENIESIFTINASTTYLKISYAVDNLVSAGFTEDYLMTLSDTINKAVKKALLKTERILLDELEGELESVKDSLIAEEEYQYGKE